MRKINLKGMGVAMITPFTENGSVDFLSLSRLIDLQLQSQTDYLVFLGTTAEIPTLTDEEQKEIIRFAVSKVKGQIPLVLGLGGNNTQSVVNKLKTEDFSEIDAILSVAPYYNRPSQEGIYQHYKHIVEASPLPIILYNVPGRTGISISAETTLRLANDFDNIIATKEASANFTQISNILQNKPIDFDVISGDDGVTLPLISIGAIGVISVIGNALPKEFGQLVHSALSGNYEKAKTIHNRLSNLFELICIDGNPAGIKSLLHSMNYIENVLRLPLVPARTSTQDSINKALHALNLQ